MKVGFMGVGYMGHGAAKNILEKGWPLVVLGNRNRTPVDDLLSRGAEEAASPADLARRSDVVFLCLPSTVEVEAAIHGEEGILGVARPGFVLVDMTTSDPNATRRIGEALRARAADMVDAPMGRTPKEAEAGELSAFVGGEPATVDAVLPLIAAYSTMIVRTGPLGSGHAMKLVNNFLAIATSAVVGEALAASLRLGLDMAVLKQVVDSAGGNSVMFQRYMHWILEGDDSHLKGMMSIAHKDLRYYRRMIDDADVPTMMAEAATQTYRLANKLGHARQFLPVLPTILANHMDGGKRTLPQRG
jgi:3-hydroxyisobutyrate dehydrogenase-like beta-hydroxyacid dehydrogenase